MSRQIADFAERQRALDPLTSFCVSAPAGSGKTELLIQRYLTLLARVDYPEQVLAITFTRKAAAEMAARINAALQTARLDEAPADSHAAQTWQLARDVLQADAQHQWRILENASRLNIKTIDSFCASLTRQMPVLSLFGGAISPVDDSLPAYRQATRALLGMLVDDNPVGADLARLLLHFDGNWARLEELLTNMLACRDQWLVYIGSGLTREGAQLMLEHSVQLVVEDGLAEASAALQSYSDALLPLLNYAAANLSKPAFEKWPANHQESLPEWLQLVDMLLTGGDSWRKTVNVKNGFPTGDAQAKEHKAEMLSLLAVLAENPELESVLAAVRYLPRGRAAEEHWELMLACTRLLPVLAAQLNVVFQQLGQVDHTQIALAALAALGDDEDPTELALKLDYSLAHILVDEFQDTAVNQYELIRRLSRGWLEHNESNPGNPRTLFIVGDGMQSIYGFRDADVGLFMRAAEQGFNGVELAPLRLQSNFRSDAQLVNWVNESFVAAFPPENHIQRGEVAFSSASAERAAAEAEPLCLAAFDKEAGNEREREAVWICDQIETGLGSPDCESMAVLVRARSHLQPIVAELKRRKLDWQAQDIDLLASSPVVRDLQTLCRALHNHCDRVAWMGLLRAPWCGLQLSDLVVVAEASPARSVWACLSDLSSWQQRLSEDGQSRCQRLVHTLSQALALRERRGLRDWVEWTWLQLGGPASAEDQEQLADASEFLKLLENLDNAGAAYDEAWLQDQVSSLYASGSAAESKLQLMTLYKAKGLEFDWVFMPALDRSPRQEQRELLLWDEHHSPTGAEGFLLAMNDQSTERPANLFNYLHRHKKLKREREATRLLYVGATRAAKRLFASGAVERDAKTEAWKPPAQQSLLAHLWPVFAVQMAEPQIAAERLPAPAPVGDNSLLRLDYQPSPVATDPAQPESLDGNLPPVPAAVTARQVGTVIHTTMERLSGYTEAELEALDCSCWQPWWLNLLRAQQLEQDRLALALKQVVDSVASVLADPRGRWILSKERQQAASELSLSSLRLDGKLSEHVIDRTYIDDKTRWIVDYKSNVPESGESLEQFLARAEQTYRPQLERYRDLFRDSESLEVRIALYFTAMPYWLELE